MLAIILVYRIVDHHCLSFSLVISENVHKNLKFFAMCQIL